MLQEWACLGASDIIGNVIGFLTTVIGIFQMQLFRDVEIPLRRFRVWLWFIAPKTVLTNAHSHLQDYCKLQDTASQHSGDDTSSGGSSVADEAEHRRPRRNHNSVATVERIP